MHSKAYRIYNKRTRSIEESIHVIFDESNDGVLSDSIGQILSLNKHSDDEEQTPKEVNPGDQQLLEVPLNTDPRDDTLSQEEEEPTNEEISTPEAPRHEVTQRNFKYKSFHPMDNLLTDISRDGNGAGWGRGVYSPSPSPLESPPPVPAPFPAAGKKFPPVPIPGGDLIPVGAPTGIFTRCFFLTF